MKMAEKMDMVARFCVLEGNEVQILKSTARPHFANSLPIKRHHMKILYCSPFSLFANASTEEKKVNIAAKLLESSPEGNVLSACYFHADGRKVVIKVEQERAVGEKQGFRMAVQPSESANGILLEGMPFMGYTTQMRFINKPKSLAYFRIKQNYLPRIQPEWAKLN